MTAESEALAAALRGILAELHPCRRLEHKHFDDDLLALGLLLLRRIEALALKSSLTGLRNRDLSQVLTCLPPGYAEGAEPQATVRGRSLIEVLE